MQRTFVGLGLALSFFVSCVLPGPAPLFARGGFGGGRGGFRGGGEEFRSAPADRGGMDGGMRSDSFRDFDHSFDHPFDHDDGAGRIDDGGLGHMDRPDAFMSPHDFGHGDPMDNGVHNYGAQRSLASDGGFSNVMRAGTGIAKGKQTWRATPASLANQAHGVRSNFNNWGAFRGDWWRNHPNAWHRGWWGDYWPWQWSSWGALAGLWGVGLSELPAYYDYGDNITYDDSGNVDYGSDTVCTAGDYYQQASDIANAGQSDDFGSSASPDQMAAPPQPGGAAALSKEELAKGDTAASGEWKPFGVYSLVQGGQTNSSTLFQLCTNKKGQIRGNYYNALTDETEPVKGSIDKKRMRAAWTVGKDSHVVYDTGVANLLKDQSPILIHFGKDTTQQWTLVRVKNPNADSSKNKA